MLTTPVLRQIKPFSQGETAAIRFDYKGNTQISRNELIIEQVSDNTVVYQQTQASFSFAHNIVIPNDLINGTNYRAKIRVGNTTDWSVFSDYVFFWVLAEPVLTITTIDENAVKDQTVEFSTTYTHVNGELLESYRYLLYDSNQNLLNSFTEKFSDGSAPLTQEIAGLEDGVTYYLEVITNSVHGQEGTTGLVTFTPDYIAPQLLTILEAVNKPSQGAIQVTASIFQLILKLYDSNNNEISQFDIDYIDNDWVDMNRPDYQNLVASEGFLINGSEFWLQLWAKDIPDNTNFLKLTAPEGEINLEKQDNQIHVFKTINGSTLSSHYVSNEFTALATDTIMIGMKQYNNAIDVYVEVVI